MPTYAELGFPGVRGDSWIGLFAPAGTPKPIIQRWHDEIKRFMDLAETREKMGALALEPVVAGPDEFEKIVRAELKDFADLARSVDLKSQ